MNYSALLNTYELATPAFCELAARRLALIADEKHAAILPIDPETVGGIFLL